MYYRQGNNKIPTKFSGVKEGFQGKQQSMFSGDASSMNYLWIGLGLVAAIALAWWLLNRKKPQAE